MILTKEDPKNIIEKINNVTTMEIVAMNNNQTQFIIYVNGEYMDVFKGVPIIRGAKIIYDDTFSEEEVRTLIMPIGITVDDIPPTIMTFEDFLVSFTNQEVCTEN